jgi:hypothetical protein
VPGLRLVDSWAPGAGLATGRQLLAVPKLATGRRAGAWCGPFDGRVKRASGRGLRRADERGVRCMAYDWPVKVHPVPGLRRAGERSSGADLRRAYEWAIRSLAYDGRVNSHLVPAYHGPVKGHPVPGLRRADDRASGPWPTTGR